MTIEDLQKLEESEDNIEFKEAKEGNYSYRGGNRTDPSKRRRCILGYITALTNEGGGYLVFGMKDKSPHQVVGSKQNLGKVGLLESNVYRDTGIRISTEEIYDDHNRRVLVIRVPARPAGKVFKFEDVPLMRVGDELTRMSDEMYLKIIQEQEPDFSEKYCSGLKIDDLDDDALRKMQQAYAEKQGNSQFLTLSKEQVLGDLGLVNGKRVTNAALILLGKKEALQKFLPQAAIYLEFRNKKGQINFDNRYIFRGPYFIIVDELWDLINLRNGKIPVQHGPYIFDIPYFNKEVIREAIHNAIAHRDYRRTSEIVIKQYPQSIEIINPGGFPIGVTLDNLLTVNSTPRNRLLADIMHKTGLVERSGQGVDKIYYQTLTEAKPEPDYSGSDDFQVELKLSVIVEDKAFALFLKEVQNSLPEDEKLSVFEVLELNKIRRGMKKEKLKKEVIEDLIKRDLVEKVGKTRGQFYRLSKQYYTFVDRKALYSAETPLEKDEAILLIINHISRFSSVKMGDFVQILSKHNWTRDQVKNLVYELLEIRYLEAIGSGRSRIYKLGKKAIKDQKVIEKALKIGLEELRKRGELK